MECEQLFRLIKEWYLQVKQETMAPARMMRFVDQHVKKCAVCTKDLLLPEEIEKIRKLVLPDSRLLMPDNEEENEAEEKVTPESAQGEEEEYVIEDGAIDEEDEMDDDEDNEDEDDLL